MKMIVDAENARVGRLGSYVAKQLLRGDEVVVINSEKIIMTGSADDAVAKVRTLRQKGSHSLRGPKFPKIPDRLLKRMIRGMLPWKKSRGREVYKNLRCVMGVGELKEDELKNVIKFENKKPVKYVTLGRLVELL